MAHDKMVAISLPDYPWISFRLDLRDMHYKVWLLLGEAVSKCIHIAHTPLQPTVAAKVHEMFLARGVLGTAAIEGNTLGEEDVKAAIHGRAPKALSDEQQVREVTNLLALVGEVGLQAATKPGLSVERLKHFNRTILAGIELDDGAVAGEFKTSRNVVGPYRAPAPDVSPALLERMCEWLSAPQLPEDFPHSRACDAILRALLAHLYIAWIHPFGDGNGRTARMVELDLLLQGGLPTPTAHLLSNHYNKTRMEYYRRLDGASKLLEKSRGVEEFFEYALQGFVDGLSKVLTYLRGQNLMTEWRQLIFEKLRDIDGNQGERLRSVAYGFPILPDDQPIPLEKVQMMTPKVAKNYASYSPRTLSRDLETLVGMGLVKKTDTGYCSNWRSIITLLPRNEILDHEKVTFAFIVQ